MGNEVLMDFSYLKMKTVMFYCALNETRAKKFLPPVASHQVRYDMVNVLAAREAYVRSRGDYFVMTANFNLHNKFTFVQHPVYYHNDHFPIPSIENKLVLVDYTRSGAQSRGGSQLGNYFCYAILDWGTEHSLRKSWWRANACAYNLPTEARLTTAMLSQLPPDGQRTLHEYLNQRT